MRWVIEGGSLQVRLSRWQRILGLMGDITVPLGDISEVTVVADPVRVAMRAGVKVGLRVPWLYFVARSIRLDEAFIVRRGVPAVSFSVRNAGPLRRVLLSTPQAAELAGALTSDRSSGAAESRS